MDEFLLSPKTPLEAVRRAQRSVAGGSFAELEEWNIRARKVAGYEELFKGVLDNESLVSMVERTRGKKGGRLCILDLMSYGFFLDDLRDQVNFDRGLALALSSPFRETDKGVAREIFGKTGLDLLTGNVLLRSAWRRVGNWLNSAGYPGFDLIFCAPGGISNFFPNEKKYYAFVLEQMWRQLNPDGGILFTETYFRNNSQNGQDEIDSLGMIPGISVQKGECSLKITRSSSAPENLIAGIK